MTHLFLDACALARRYFTDAGSRNIDQLLALTDTAYCTDILGIPETAGALRATLEDTRWRAFQRPEFEAAMELLLNHWRTQYQVIALNPQAANDAWSLIYRHYLRGADAIHLALALQYHGAVRSADPKDAVVLVTSDHRLIKAATAEGLRVFHFWRCQCPLCGLEFQAKKGKLNKHGNCTFSCNCGRQECTSTYQVTIDKLLAV